MISYVGTLAAGRSTRLTASDAKALLDSVSRGEFVVGPSILNYIIKITKPLYQQS